MHLNKLITGLLLATQNQNIMAKDPLPLRITTFNIRYATTSPFENEQPWSVRRPLVINQLNATATAAPAGAEPIFGLQEVLHEQLIHIKTGLGPEWAHIGVGRDDGAEAGEYNPILYRPAALHLLYSEVKWLSPTPDEPSWGWDAGSRRIVVIAVFEHRASGRRWIAANTHLDDQSGEARVKGVRVALASIRAVQEKWGPLAVSLTGDFNSEPRGDAYSTVVDSGYLEELHTLAPEFKRFGPEYTFTGFLPDEEDKAQKRIDFIWVGPEWEKRWTVDRYEVLPNVKDNIHISDHRAVFADLKVRT